MQQRCVLIRPGEAVEGVTGVTYAAGISAKTTGSSRLCLQLASLPPGARARAHLHAEHESAAYVLEGRMVLWSGARLEEELIAGPGDFLYIPTGIPHLVANASDQEPAVAVLARTDANEQEDMTALPELDDLPHLRIDLGAG